MRGTIHFVAPEDVRWMLKLLTPRVIARQTTTFLARFGLDDAAFGRCRDLLAAALQGGKQLTRGAIYDVLELGGVSTTGGRGLQILWRLAQEGLICFAARQGKQPTFALLDEWVPAGKDLTGEGALAELALRYFSSHGPATVQDFAWWSGLSLTDAREGLELVKPRLAHDESDARTYWFSAAAPGARAADTGSVGSQLLPAYDEFTVAYKDRRIALDPAHHDRSPFDILSPTIAVNGQVVGNWKRELKRDSVVVTSQPFGVLSDSEAAGFVSAAGDYGRFLGLPVIAS